MLHANRTGTARTPEDESQARAQLDYYFVFGNLKIAGIIQQIYARYVGGYTQDARFAKLGHVVDYLIGRAERAAGLR